MQSRPIQTIPPGHPIRNPGAGHLRQGAPEEHPTARLLGCSPQFAALVDALPAVAQQDQPVFLTGETGTGKDLIAETLHTLSPRSADGFVKLTVSPDMVDATAKSQKTAPSSGERFLEGALRRSGEGTLYVTELGDVPLPQQDAIRMALSDPASALRCRLMLATNAEPAALRMRKRLHPSLEKLLVPYRLHILPLREREGDVVCLAGQFLARSAAAMGKEIAGFAPDALAVLKAAPFPGNVRELRNVVEYAAMICPERIVRAAHLPPHFSA